MKTQMNRLSVLMAFCAALLVSLVGAPASAAVTTAATPSIVEYMPGALLIQIPGASAGNYMGVLSAVSGCSANNQTIDTLKAWQALAQSALLSGKNLRIYFTSCNGVLYISTVDLNAQ
jgi:hypothetical protein